MESVKTLIIGSGFGGLCMGIKLKQAGLNDFLILEKADDLGGTWRENTYPGAECDIPSALYSYSFEHNSEWEFKWSGQAQIHKYQHDTARKHGLPEHIRYQQRVVAARFNDDSQRWLVSTENGSQYDAQHVVCAVGQLHHPSTPSFNGVELFQGETFHAAQWKHDINLEGKRVGVIGNAASAVQFIPEVAKVAKQLTVYQRSPNWILPKLDRPYRKWEQSLSAKFPVITKMYRWMLWALGEYGVLPAIRGNKLSRWAIRKACLGNLNKHIQDPEVRKQLTPNYTLGAKRVLFSDHYYAALAQANVTLNTHGVEAFTSQGIQDKSGEAQEFDVVIYGTGFKTNPFLADIDLQGSQGKHIRDAWSDGAQAYLGVSTHGFPNFHMLYGPNTNLGHTSIIIMLEAQAGYVLQSIQYLDSNKFLSSQVKAEPEHTYNQEIQRRLAQMAFSEIDQSWYKDGDKVTNNWAGGTKEYVRRLKKVDWSAYSLS